MISVSPSHAVTVIKNPLSDNKNPEINFHRTVEESPEKESDQSLEEEDEVEKAESEDSNFIETYVEQQLKEHVYPLKTELEEKTIKISDLTQNADKLKAELEKLDTHYEGVCKAILKTQGIQIADLESHSIFSEYQKQMDKNQKKLLERKNKKAADYDKKKKEPYSNDQGIAK